MTKFEYAPVGARVHNRYWNEDYQVLAHQPEGYVTIKWLTGPDAGRIRSHCTPFEHGRDWIVDHNGNAQGRAGLRDHAGVAEQCWCAEQLPVTLDNPTVKLTLDTHNRILGLRRNRTYRLFWNGRDIGTMDGQDVASRLRMSTAPHLLTFTPISHPVTR